MYVIEPNERTVTLIKGRIGFATRDRLEAFRALARQRAEDLADTLQGTASIWAEIATAPAEWVPA